MPDPDYGKITDARVAEYISRIGLDLRDDSYLPLDPEVAKSFKPRTTNFNHQVGPDVVRHFVNGYGDDNPLYCDPEYAKTTRWGTLVAPPTFIWTLGGEDEPPRTMKPEVAARLKGDPLRGVGDLQSDLRYEFFRPLRDGDRIYSKRAMTGAVEKRSSWGGRAIHSTRSFVTRNQDGEIVHMQRGMWIRAERKPIAEIKDPQPAPEPYTDEQLAEIDAAYANETRRGGEPRYWEDVTVGEELPVHVKGPIRLTDMILFHAGFGQSFPTYAHKLAYRTRKSTPGLYTRNKLNVWDIVQRMHWEKDWAVQVGAPEMYDYGAIRETFLCHLITAWQGDDGWLWKFNVQHRRFNFVGDTNWLKGRVTGKEMTEAGGEVHLDVWIENQRGVVISPGSAVVLLPTRARGPVSLPNPPTNDMTEFLRKEVRELATMYGQTPNV